MLVKPKRTHAVDLHEFRRWAGKVPRLKDLVALHEKLAIADVDRVTVYGALFDAQVIAYSLRMCQGSSRVRLAILDGEELGIWGDDWIVLVCGISRFRYEGRPVDRAWPEAAHG